MEKRLVRAEKEKAKSAEDIAKLGLQHGDLLASFKAIEKELVETKFALESARDNAATLEESLNKKTAEAKAAEQYCANAHVPQEEYDAMMAENRNLAAELAEVKNKLENQN